MGTRLKVCLGCCFAIALFSYLLMEKKYLFNENSSEFLNEYVRKITFEFQKRIDKNVPKGSILIFGDSLVQGLAVTAISPKAINFGIGNDTSLDLLNRIPEYHSIKTADLIMIAIGINDIYKYSKEASISHIEEILSSIKSNYSGPIILNSLLPVDEATNKGLNQYNRKIQTLNTEIESIAHSGNNILYLDSHKKMVDQSGNLHSNYHIGDGLHLNDKGNNQWIEIIKQFIQVYQKSQIIK